MLVVCIVWTVKSRTAPLYSSRASPLLHGDMSSAHRAHSLWIKPNYSKSTASVHRNPHTVFVSTTNLLTTPHYSATNTVLFAVKNLTVGLIYTKKANWLQQMSNRLHPPCFQVTWCQNEIDDSMKRNTHVQISHIYSRLHYCFRYKLACHFSHSLYKSYSTKWTSVNVHLSVRAGKIDFTLVLN